MVGQSKILTVSYGTFSCTLEGFDEPFSTMRGIAEYFRDLAADDRYFGAEPPTPDAEMLHKIAEREIRARVDARVEDGAVVLRQAEPVSEPANAAEPDTEITPEASKPAAPTPPAASPVPAATARPKTLSVAEKLAQLRAVLPEDEGLNNQANEAAAGDFVQDSIQDAFDQDAPVPVIAPVASPVPEAATTSETEFPGEAEDKFEDVNPVAQTDVFDTEADEPEIDVESVDDAPTQEVETDTQTQLDDVEPLVLQDQDIVDVSDIDLEADDESLKEPVAPEVDLSDMSFEEDDVENQPVQEEAIDLESILADDGAEDALNADTNHLDLSDEPQPGPMAEEETTAEVDFAALIAAESDAADVEAAELAAMEPSEDEAAVSRILKMRKSDFEAFAQEEENQRQIDRQETIVIDPVPQEAFGTTDEAIETDVNSVADATADDAETPAAQESEIASNLSEDDEADLMKSLSKLEDEAIDFDYDEDELDDEDEDDDADFSSVPIDSPSVGAASVERLFDVTNSEMAGRESSRRRSAIAHLKAAVAATRADRAEVEASGNKVPETDSDFDISAYREDLARVVRPKRPADKPNSEQRRLPPLMLVSEQRIDDNLEDEIQSLTQDPVRPRRIETDEADNADDDENIFSDAGSFAEFAAEMGAHDLPDLLEAAAAYYSYVEGQEHFSRPQIMKAVAAIDDEGGFNREDGLRSFGQLLRNGKIHKIRRGQFEIDKSTRFRPQQIQVGA